MELPRITPPPASDESAREKRMAKLMALEISTKRYKRVRIVVRNLSPHGIGARGEIDLVPCEQVVIHMPDGRDLSAIVRWVRKNTFGLSLDDRIDTNALKSQSASLGHLPTKDDGITFQRFQHVGSTARSGFKRSHRDEVLKTNSTWVDDLGNWPK
jgi:hypothetical protein